ncbi:hypothetical protein CFN78_16040 [Amycolatopsis antarctica]|uniref:DUF3048 domain-containing protein n=1 Tax=Amycolatopsis antarctica TaxID=1854586 RepID=A0A263D1U3_9PSEU|nr:DUF3048 domain-containing protein [Amycolatopsis antarctica]OZM72058.1 hypothetical protein CFN78_16040 [Amycolatopsis antarctica]
MRSEWEWLRFALAVLLGAAAITGAVVLLNGGPEPAPPPVTGGPAAPGIPGSPALPGVVAVKIDNVPPARPQTGIGAADTVYVEPVEGGFTRLMAIYDGELPDTVGPVRSARLTDVDILAQYGNPVLAYSGAAPETLPALRAAPLTGAAPEDTGGAYYRDPARRAPHDLFVRPADLPGPGPGAPPREDGPAPDGGTRADRHDVAYPAASFTLRWSPEAARWLVEMDGEPVVSTDSGPVAPATVVEQRVTTAPGAAPDDAAGNASPVAVTIGGGDAVVLRDGLRFDGTWSRPDPGSPTVFRDANGSVVPFAEGPVWVLLVPA